MTEQGREKSGEFTEKISDKKIIEVLKKHQPIDAKSLSDEIKKEQDISLDRTTIYKRLQKLEKQEKVSSKKLSQNRIWQINK